MRWRVHRAFGIAGVTLVMACAGTEGDRAAAVERFTGDLDAMRARGQLRMLIPPGDDVPGLPRRSAPFRLERVLVETFAEELGLELVPVRVDEYGGLISALVEGRGDVIVAGLTATEERARDIAFGAPIWQVREVVVTHRDSAPVTAPADLAGRTVTVRQSSSYWSTLDSLKQVIPNLTIVAGPPNERTEDLLHDVADGRLDVTVADDVVVDFVQSYHPALRADIPLTGSRDIAWGVRQDNPELRRAIGAFLAEFNPDADRPARYTGDLPAIRERRVLRVLTRNNAESYFVWRGEIMGFDHDLAVEFAKQLGVHVEFVVAPTRAALFAWLLDGRGDVVAASITTRESASGAFAASRPYNRVVETVVTRASDSLIQSVEDLAGRTLAVRRVTSYWNTAQTLLRDGAAFRLVTVPEGMETDEILERVAQGEYDATIADSHILAIELAWRDDIRPAFAVSDTVTHSWVTRATEPQLLAAIDSFFVAIDRSAFYNITKRKYFESPRAARSRVATRAAVTGRLSPYDDLTRHYASRYEFDWRTISAQMYEESRFDPEVVSFAGAVGLMQVMPRTARGFGFDSLHVPETNIHAGTRYLRHVYAQLDDVPDPEERFWFALASYNAGLGHIRDAQQLAEEEGLDPNRWFGHVAEVAPLLQRRSVHQRFQHGYCRCTEPVAYVRKIRERERAYREVVADR
jgi:membrane-bound lytic murein transglycosylase F